ncbi:hypothetical protein YC2023_016414 [Brassica napus]
MSEDMHSPSLQYLFWILDSEEVCCLEHGSVDASVEFVNWAMRCVAATFIFQEKSRGSKSVAGTSHGRAEFLSRPGGGQWNSARIAPSSFGSPLVYYYSKYHLTPNRKKLSREEYEELTQETTREGMAGLAASPGFSD